MNQVLLILHLLGFGAAAAAGIGNGVVGAQIAASPGDAPVFQRIHPILARIGQIGLALLWITGPILLWSKYDGGAGISPAFWLKLLGAVVITVLVVMIDLRIRKVQKSDMSAAAQLPLLGRIAGLTLLWILIFAVITFN